jgi:phage FluMu protein Com
MSITITAIRCASCGGSLTEGEGIAKCPYCDTLNFIEHGEARLKDPSSKRSPRIIRETRKIQEAILCCPDYKPGHAKYRKFYLPDEHGQIHWDGHYFAYGETLDGGAVTDTEGNLRCSACGKRLHFEAGYDESPVWKFVPPNVVAEGLPQWYKERRNALDMFPEEIGKFVGMAYPTLHSAHIGPMYKEPAARLKELFSIPSIVKDIEGSGSETVRHTGYMPGTLPIKRAINWNGLAPIMRGVSWPSEWTSPAYYYDLCCVGIYSPAENKLFVGTVNGAPKYEPLPAGMELRPQHGGLWYDAVNKHEAIPPRYFLWTRIQSKEAKEVVKGLDWYKKAKAETSAPRSGWISTKDGIGVDTSKMGFWERIKFELGFRKNYRQP